MKNIATKLKVSSKGAHVSLVQFSTDAVLEIPFSDDITQFTSKVDALAGDGFGGGGTSIDTGLDLAFDKMFQTANGMRAASVKCRKTVIVLTDGENNTPLEPMDAAKQFHDARIRVVVIGIGLKVNKAELRSLVELDSDLHIAKDFDQLTSNHFVNGIVDCEELSRKLGYI